MWLCCTLAFIWWPQKITVLPLWILQRQSIFAFQVTSCCLNLNLPLVSFCILFFATLSGHTLVTVLM